MPRVFYCCHWIHGSAVTMYLYYLADLGNYSLDSYADCAGTH